MAHSQGLQGLHFIRVAAEGAHSELQEVGLRHQTLDPTSTTTEVH